MKINKVKVENYRLLKEFTLDLRDNLSLIVGKNNTGKTSLLTVMDKFLGSNRSKKIFNWDDFSIDFQKEFYNDVKEFDISSEENVYESKGIKMQLEIKYTEEDSYKNIKKYMMDLDPENDVIILDFSYSFSEDKLNELQKIINEKNLIDMLKFNKYMNKEAKKYFRYSIVARRYDYQTKEVASEKSDEIQNSEISKLINFKIIKANRDASNKDNDHSLSRLSSDFFNITKGSEKLSIDELTDLIEKTDEGFNNIYNGDTKNDGIFKQLIESVSQFGGMTGKNEISIESTISEIDLLSNNTTLFYKHQDQNLPENYNGLGYLNLIGMIFEMETIISEFHNYNNDHFADINLIFIEEPEAHTHPQLQYIFMKNIKQLINERKKGTKGDYNYELNLQTIITTHSSHILSSCEDFNDIIYLKHETNNVVAKNLKSLEEKYSKFKANEKVLNNEELKKWGIYKFIKQYLTLNSSELFFADKVVIIEGDTERILLPSMMKKVDKIDSTEKEGTIPLLSQNISILSVGAHAYIFKPLIDFLGLKALVITDIDGVKKETYKNGKTVRKSCPSKDAQYTSNNTIKKFFNKTDEEVKFGELTELEVNEKIIDNNLRIAFQVEQDGYLARSFEDAFLQENYSFVFQNKDSFILGLKNRGEIEQDSQDYYYIAKKCINEKTAFATETLLIEGGSEKDWVVPKYIEEGLLWLKMS